MQEGATHPAVATSATGATSGQLQAEFRKAYGRALKMNRDFYPAVFRAALHDTSLQEELDLDE
ncbi:MULTISPECIES: hypothetical protein [Halobacterium]|uniref:hypothetical protein n=1 Tax=Halobacterium TaxID=2239 RepID=UPI0019629ED8|nr:MULTISPECIES: hypothetical protein [Halobacterium]MCF2208385.1 hypothetical protein [Halobacterium salinarum]QRY26401.1 hypothetical protein JRZ79_13185 [Halobacterium sp. BOL4-2]